MTAHRIASIDDPLIAAYRDLPGHREDRFLIAEGALLVERLLQSDYEVESLFVEENRADEWLVRTPESVPLFVATRELFREVLGFKFHRGVLACGRRKPLLTLNELLVPCPARFTMVVCDAISDPENVGGILRNCAAFGVDAVLFGPDCSDPFSRRVLRVSMGTVLKLKLVGSESLSADLNSLKQDYGFELVATVLDPDARVLRDYQRPKRAALLFGNEAFGLRREVAELCDHPVTIPMRLGTDSLNVSVASGIFLHHFQAKSVDPDPSGNA